MIIAVGASGAEALTALAVALIWAAAAYPAYWVHLESLAKWQPR